MCNILLFSFWLRRETSNKKVKNSEKNIYAGREFLYFTISPAFDMA